MEYSSKDFLRNQMNCKNIEPFFIHSNILVEEKEAFQKPGSIIHL
jgi:hypothetical protein